LRPAAMAQVPLEELLRRLAASTESNARLPVTLDADAGPPLPARVRVSLYRIAQEAVNNVVKHAAASQVWITLRPVCGDPGASDGAGTDADDSREPTGVELTIRDDGHGFDAGVVGAEHLGLAIMRERAGDIRARLDLITAQGQGTTVRVTWSIMTGGVLTGTRAGDGAIDSDEADLVYQRQLASWRISAEEGGGALDDKIDDAAGGSDYG
jgi:nitrate/nitrite-specific signal transduction histidine kinase